MNIKQFSDKILNRIRYNREIILVICYFIYIDDYAS